MRSAAQVITDHVLDLQLSISFLVVKNSLSMTAVMDGKCAVKIESIGAI